MLTTSSFTKHSGVVFNLLFSAYILFLQPLVAPRFEATFSEIHATDNLLVGLLLTAAVLEFFGSRLKLRHIGAQAAQEGKTPNPGTGFLFLFIFRMVIASMITMFILQALNLNPESHAFIFFVIWMGLLGKELVVYLSLPHTTSNKPTPKTPSWAADLLILPFTCLAYTSFWGVLFARQKPLLWTASNTGEVIFYVIAASILFLLIVFLPLRMIYLFEEVTLANTKKERYFIALSTIFTAILAGVSLVDWR